MHHVRELFWLIADLIGINALWRQLTRHNTCILMYHGISREQPPAPCWTVLEYDRFEKQLAHIARVATVVPLRTYLDQRTSHNSLTRKQVVLTFDDGLRNNFRDAAPLLRSHGFQATQFVVPQLARERKRVWADDVFLRLIHNTDQPVTLTGTPFATMPAETIDERKKRVDTVIDHMKSLPDSERMQTFAAILSATEHPPDASAAIFDLATFEEVGGTPAGEPFRFAPHTNTHPILSRQPLDRQESEISGSWRDLRNSGLPCENVFAYPNGRDTDFNSETAAIVQRLGLRAALTTEDRHATPTDDPYRIPRVNIGQGMSDGEFRARVSGFYYFLRDWTK